MNTLALIVMVVIVVRFILWTINRVSKAPPVHGSVFQALDAGILIGAILWLMAAAGWIVLTF